MTASDNTLLSLEAAAEACSPSTSGRTSDAVICKTKVRRQVRFAPDVFIYMHPADINSPGIDRCSRKPNLPPAATGIRYPSGDSTLLRKTACVRF